jgi:hypothetical protein
MSSNNRSTVKTNESSNTPLLSKITQASGGDGNWIIIFFTLLSVGMFIGSFVSMSQFVGSKDNWNVIQPQITKILILTLIGTFGLIMASLLYYIQDSAKTIYFILVLCCLSLGLSYASLAISAISR